MAEWHPGSLTELVMAIRAGVVAANVSAIEGLATQTAHTARTNATNGAHARGTPTPSAPGTGPATISGLLRNSLRVMSSTSSGSTATAVVGSNVIYARAQELGAVIHPVRAKYLSWVDAKGTRYFRRQVTLPPRPYLRPAMPDRYQVEARYKVDLTADVLLRTGAFL